MQLKDNNQLHWETCYSNYTEMFGEIPSDSAKKAVEIFKKEGKTKILELGGGQGRDTIFFAQNGFHVWVLDYSENGIQAIKSKAQKLGLSQFITAIKHDVRNKLPFDDEIFDACYSHMFFCMALTTKELELASNEIKRVLKSTGLNIYTVRNTNDSHYAKGIHIAEDMYEMNGFVVHFFNKDKIEYLSKGFEQITIDEFEEGQLPRKLYCIILRKK